MQNGSSTHNLPGNDKPPTTLTIRVRVRLEPELEMMAATWTAVQCDTHAAKLERFARQLRVKAKILRRDLAPVRKKIRWQQPALAFRN